MLALRAIGVRNDNMGNDDFDVMLLEGQFSSSQRASMYALIAFSSILLLSAIIATVITITRSWLKSNGRRNRSRLSIFLICLLTIAGARAISISILVDNLNGPSNWSRYGYYDSYSFLVRHVFDGLCSLIAELSIFVLVLFEITRSHSTAYQKHSIFEWANLALIFCLFMLLITCFGIDARYVMGPWNEDYGYEASWAALPGIQTTYATLAVVFASEILFVVCRKSFPKSQKTLLIAFSVALWLGQVFDLAKTTVRFFSPTSTAYTQFWALSSVTEIMWAVKLLAMALLSKHSYTMIRSGKVIDETAIAMDKPGRHSRK